MNTPGKLFLSAVIGGILGYAASRFLFLQWLTLIPWGLAALLVGYFSTTRRQSVLNGIAFGFFMGFIFMAAGYTGNDPIITKIPFFASLGIVSAACGALASVVGHMLNRRRVAKP